MKVLIMCIAGGTTSMVASKVKEAARKAGKYDIEIDATAVSQGNLLAPKYDFLLCGPHVAFKVDEFKKLFPEKAVASISPVMFGRMDGKGILALIEDEWAKQVGK